MIEKTLPKSLKLLYNFFKTQNIEKGHFDVEFHFGGDEILYAHKTILWPISTVFEERLFGSWKDSSSSASNKATKIPIENYSYENFKEFLTYFYIEKCKISNDNVISIVDLSEYYHLETLKEKCDKYLSKMEVEKFEIILWLEFSKLYSLKFASMHFLDLLRSNISDLIYSECFLKAKKDTVKAIISSRWLNISEEELFDAVLKWAKENIEKGDDDNFEESLKKMLKEILPQILKVN
uniref:BTB domain-containing protein n=1 Tax=Panagrolaimus superbus TaxID=310955 RepID=A0A914XVZ7_9BILA